MKDKDKTSPNETPASLAIGTQVSAKYKGAFCEAKVRNVVKQVKCRVTFKTGGLGSVTLSDQYIKCQGNLIVGSSVQAHHPDKQEYLDAIVNKIQDQSQYTVVFDDGDITTLRRNALCMKSGKHYNASESLDNLPLTHPEHFSTPVGAGSSRRRKRGTPVENSAESDEDSGSEPEETISSSYLSNIGRVVWAENTENKKSKSKDTWFPALIVAPSASDTVKINTKEEFLIRSFKDGRYYTISKKDTSKFNKDGPKKNESNHIKDAVEKAVGYLESKTLPPHWDKEILFNMGEESSPETSESEELEDDDDDESREEKDHLVAELYKHMEDRGAPINKTPNIVGKDLDLYKLFRIVYKYGGHQRVTNNNKWRQVAGKLGFETTWCVNQVRVNYKRYLQSFEELYKTLGCTMKSGTSKRFSAVSGGRVQIRGSRSRISKLNENGNEASKKDEFFELKEEPSDLQEVKSPTFSSKKVKKGTASPPMASTPPPAKKKSVVGDEPKMSTRLRRDSGSSTSSTVSVKCLKEEPLKKPESAKKETSAKKSLASVTPKEEKSSPKSPIVRMDRDKETETEAKKLKPSKEIDSTELKTSGSSSKVSQTPGRKKIKDKKSTTSSSASLNNTPSSGASVLSSSIQSQEEVEKRSEPSTSHGEEDEEEPQHLLPGVEVKVGDKIKVFYIRGIIYDAKVIKCQDTDKKSKWPRYYVHYQGWNARYDEWINRSRIAENLSWNKSGKKEDKKISESESKKEESSKREGKKESRKDENRKDPKRGEDGRKEYKKELSKKDLKKESKKDESAAKKSGKTSGSNKRESSRSSTPIKVDKNSLKNKIKKESESDDEDLSKLVKKPPGTPLKDTPRRRGRKKREEIDENEDIEVEKEDDDKQFSPSKPKRGRNAVEDCSTPTKIRSTPSRDKSKSTPVKQKSPIQMTTKKSSPVPPKKVSEEPEQDEDPYAFQDSEDFVNIKFESSPKISSPKYDSKVEFSPKCEEPSASLKDEPKSSVEPSEAVGSPKPILQLTEKQKELFPFLSSIIDKVNEDGECIEDPEDEEDPIEEQSFSTSIKEEQPLSQLESTESKVEKSLDVEEKNKCTKKRRSKKKYNSSELVSDSESEVETTKDDDIVKLEPQIPSPKKPFKKEDDVDLACEEIIPRSPVHPGITDSISSIESPSSVVGLQKLEMPFATVPQSGLSSSPGASTSESTDISSNSRVELPFKIEEPIQVPSTAHQPLSIAKEQEVILPKLPVELIPPSENISSDVDSPIMKPDIDFGVKFEAENLESSSSKRGKRKAPELPNPLSKSPLVKRKRRTKDASLGIHLGRQARGRGRHFSGRLRGLNDDETDESEETRDSIFHSLGSLDNEALAALCQKSPKSTKYNFYVDLDPSMDYSERISKIQNSLEELRQAYINTKSQLATIERRRKKIRRKERERSSAGNSGNAKNLTQIEVNA